MWHSTDYMEAHQLTSYPMSTIVVQLVFRHPDPNFTFSDNYRFNCTYYVEFCKPKISEKSWNLGVYPITYGGVIPNKPIEEDDKDFPDTCDHVNEQERIQCFSSKECCKNNDYGGIPFGFLLLFTTFL